MIVQIEEKKKKKEEERKKKLAEDEREEMRVKKEMDELRKNSRYQKAAAWEPCQDPIFGRLSTSNWSSVMERTCDNSHEISEPYETADGGFEGKTF